MTEEQRAGARALDEAARQWWREDGSYYDPDTSDVPMDVKWPHIAQYGYVCGYKAALQQPAQQQAPAPIPVHQGKPYLYGGGKTIVREYEYNPMDYVGEKL